MAGIAVSQKTKKRLSDDMRKNSADTMNKTFKRTEVVLRRRSSNLDAVAEVETEEARATFDASPVNWKVLNAANEQEVNLVFDKKGVSLFGETPNASDIFVPWQDVLSHRFDPSTQTFSCAYREVDDSSVDEKHLTLRLFSPKCDRIDENMERYLEYWTKH